MVGYLFYPTADTAQDRIWRDTAKLWGEDKADTYIRGLHGHLEKLCITRALWRSLPIGLTLPADIKGVINVSRYRRHYLFFRELPSGKIGVMSILHERMDIPARLMEELEKLVGDFSGEN